MTAGRPERIGRYLVREVIGAGAFATVYRATDERLDVDVAVKVLAENHSLDADVRDRFIREGRLLRRVRSPHLAVVHDLGETVRAQPYLVLEWADRGDLAGRVAAMRSRGGRPAPADALTLARALAAALGVLHGHRVVHRDLSPGNVLLRSLGPGPGPTPAGPDGGLFAPDEQLLLADLGMSKDLARASGLTVAAGTSGFAPPEQREAGGTVDARADVWAASALIVWMALGRPPDEAGRWRTGLGEAGWPPGVAHVLDRGLDPSPGRRQQTIEAWLLDLEAVLATPAPAAPSTRSSSESSTWSSARSPVSRAGWRRRLATAAAVVAALAAGYATAPDPADPPAVRTEELPGGRERSVVKEHGITVTVEGPTEVAVGEPARLSAAVSGAESWTWVAPDGSLHPERHGLDVVAATSGHLTVRLVAVDDRGRMVEASRRVDVPAP